MIRKYGWRLVHRKFITDVTEGTGRNQVLMPAASFVNSATSIPVTTQTMTDLYKPTALYNRLADNNKSSGNYFCMAQPVRNVAGNTISNIDDGGNHTFGCFGYPVGSSTSQVTAPANRWACCLTGFDSRWNGVQETLGRFNLAPYWVKYRANVPACGYTTAISFTFPAGFQMLGMWLTRLNTVANWWTPLLSINYPGGKLTAQTTCTVAAYTPTSQTTNSGDYVVEVAGLLDAPFALTEVNVTCPGASSGEITFTCPANFRLYGVYPAQTVATGAYWPVLWGIILLNEVKIAGITNDFYSYITGGTVRFDPPLNQPEQVQSHAGFGVRLVGVVA